MPALKLAVGDGADDDAVDSRMICPITHEGAPLAVSTASL